MPSVSHESLVSLFRDCPALAPRLLRESLGVDIPAWARPTVTSAEFIDLKPPEYRADTVVRLDEPDIDVAELPERKPHEIVIVEVQLDRDGSKRRSWPFYSISAWARFRCRATVLVVTIDEAIAR